MLATTPVITFIPTRDAACSRDFFENTLGLRFLSNDNFALVMDANGIMLRIIRVGEFTPFPFTILGWEVHDIDTTVTALTAQGVTFARYSFFDQSPLGIWTAPGNVAKVAWFQDPDGNTLSLSQHLTP